MSEAWTHEGKRITDPEVMARLRAMPEDGWDLIVEHRFLHGSRRPHHFVVESAHELDEYLETKVKPGDHVVVWNLFDCCTDERIIAIGTVPDAEGRTPVGGAY